jgi:hypothetical protein
LLEDVALDGPPGTHSGGTKILVWPEFIVRIVGDRLATNALPRLASSGITPSCMDPLGAGAGGVVVRWSGRIYEVLAAARGNCGAPEGSQSRASQGLTETSWISRRTVGTSRIGNPMS